MAEASGDPPEGAARPRGWTSILFVHGMGSQRRYGDVSALVEALDQHARAGTEGHFAGIDVKLEPSSRPDASPVAYLEGRWEHQDPAGRTIPRRHSCAASGHPLTGIG